MPIIQKIFNLVKKTGEKAVILDEKGENGFVVLPLDEYERLIFGKNSEKDLTEDGILDTINRDIENWKEDPIDDDFLNNHLDEHSVFGPKYFTDDCLEDDDELSDDDRYYFEPID